MTLERIEVADRELSARNGTDHLLSARRWEKSMKQVRCIFFMLLCLFGAWSATSGLASVEEAETTVLPSGSNLLSSNPLTGEADRGLCKMNALSVLLVLVEILAILGVVGYGFFKGFR